MIITKDVFDIQGENEETESDAYVVRLMLQNLAYETLPDITSEGQKHKSAIDLLEKLSTFLGSSHAGI